MPTPEQLTHWLGATVIMAPALLVFALGVASLVDWKLSERTINRLIQAAVVTGLLAAAAVLIVMLLRGDRHVVIQFGDWVAIPHFHFSIKFVFDRLSVPLAILSFMLTGTIGAFASKYMHREGGYNRFFVLYSLFLLGMVVAALADTIETLFAGWELVGLSSALLVAFFQDRPAPARNGFWVWIVYRVSDAALLLAAVVLHHHAASGEGDFDRLLSIGGYWPYGHTSLHPHLCLMVGLLLVVAAAGKSALVPFSGWLPRAMEGPTPSSAIFYGALSVHLGVFLLLRASPIIEASPWLCAALVVLGLATAILAWLAGSVQTDVKSALSYACLSQVGIMVAEIGLGLRYIPLIHLIGHACLRTLQFVRAPSLLQDYRTLENAIGEHLPRTQGPARRFAQPISAWLYRFALERGYLDAILRFYIVESFVRVFHWCDWCERAWTDLLTGDASRESDQVGPAGAIDEL
jgi:NADH:ubiquinone oxidoreductase subunit 5 (subunit L)/multisubunit Na+/H+ antiporter MnhA subunit